MILQISYNFSLFVRSSVGAYVLKIMFLISEMAEYMKTVAEEGTELSSEERNLLSVAYKNVIGARRAAWRIVSSLEGKADKEGKGDPSKETITKDYKTKIEDELNKICDEIIDLLEKTLIPNSVSEDGESKVFFYKM